MNPGLRKSNSQTHTILQLRLHFQSPSLLTTSSLCPAVPHSWYSPAPHTHCSALASPVKQHLLHSWKQMITLLLWQKTEETAKPNTHKVLSPEIRELHMKKISLEHIRKRPGAVWDFFSFRFPWFQTQSTSGYLA